FRVQPLFPNDRLVHPDAIPAFSVGRTFDRMHPSPAREPKPRSYGRETNGWTLQIEPADGSACKRGNRRTEDLRDLEYTVEGYPATQRIVHDLGRHSTSSILTAPLSIALISMNLAI